MYGVRYVRYWYVAVTTAVQRRKTQWSQMKREDHKYLLPIAVGINLQVWEQVRKLAHARIGSPTAIAKAHRLRAACTEDTARTRSMASDLFFGFISIE